MPLIRATEAAKSSIDWRMRYMGAMDGAKVLFAQSDFGTALAKRLRRRLPVSMQDCLGGGFSHLLLDLIVTAISSVLVELVARIA